MVSSRHPVYLMIWHLSFRTHKEPTWTLTQSPCSPIQVFMMLCLSFNSLKNLSLTCLVPSQTCSLGNSPVMGSAMLNFMDTTMWNRKWLEMMGPLTKGVFDWHAYYTYWYQNHCQVGISFNAAYHLEAEGCRTEVLITQPCRDTPTSQTGPGIDLTVTPTPHPHYCPLTKLILPDDDGNDAMSTHSHAFSASTLHARPPSCLRSILVVSPMPGFHLLWGDIPTANVQADPD